MSPVSQKKDADQYLQKLNKLKEIKINKKEILNHWYINDNQKWMTYLYALYQHSPFIRINPEHNIGHEIYGLFEKS